MARQPRLLIAAAGIAAIAACSIAVGHVEGLDTVVLFLLPALLLGFALLGGVHPGARTIARLRSWLHRRSTRRPVRLITPSPSLVLTRVGRRLAFALAVRPPPSARLAQS